MKAPATSKQGILVFFHCAANTGYAIGTLEKTFFRMAEAVAGGDWGRIHFAYPGFPHGMPTTLPDGFGNILEFNPASTQQAEGDRIADYLRRHNISVAFGFDQPASRPMYRYLRQGGIQQFISYWGAPMSSLNRAPKLWLKKIEVALYRHGPDRYIFESRGMARTATHGRGIPAAKVSTVYLGIDTDKYRPDTTDSDYARAAFGIPGDRRIFFYSGHMEERKGVHVLIRAARRLYEAHARRDFHLLILGNRNGEERHFDELLDGPHRTHITFGGYRDDIERLHRGCYAGAIGSTGWDSLTCSALEMSASGLPLLVSDLPGLNEAIDANITGQLFPPGDHETLARLMAGLLDNPSMAEAMGRAARDKALRDFSVEKQLGRLTEILSSAMDSCR